MTEQPAAAGLPVREYDLTFNRVYRVPAVPPPEPGEPGAPPPGPDRGGLVSVLWDGLELNAGNEPGGFTAIVENLEGWHDSPPVTGNDTARELADGGWYGHKVLGPRTVTVTGAAAGPRARLMRWRDELTARACGRAPAELRVGDPWLHTALSAQVRTGQDQFKHAFFAGPTGFRYQVQMTAADPRLYEQDWHQLVLTTRTAADAGRGYPRGRPARPAAGDGEPSFPWEYGSAYPPGSAGYLANDGNAPAPVMALYEGDLAASRLADDEGSAILLAPVGPGVAILVQTAELTATAEGGAPRHAFIQPGSRPLAVPAFSTARWHLYSTGSGTVTLAWRCAWW